MLGEMNIFDELPRRHRMLEDAVAQPEKALRGLIMRYPELSLACTRFSMRRATNIAES